MKDVGVIGVGLMGHGIAKNLLKKGFSLHYFDHPGNQSTADLDDAGAQKWASAAAMAAQVDVLILCVTGSPQVEDVLIGSGDVLQALRADTIVMDCSTAIPSSTVALMKMVAAKGALLVDAAMTRTPKEAEEGRLNLLVGGDSAVIERLRPVMDAFAENIFHAGGTGTGHQLKLLHNLVSLGSVTLISEVAACAARGGVNMATFVDCLRKGGGSGVALDRLSPYIERGDATPLRFTIRNAFKDASYYHEMATELTATTLIAKSILDTFERLVRDGHGDAFVPEQFKLLQQ